METNTERTGVAMGLNRNADEVEGMGLGENEARSETVSASNDTVGQTSHATEPHHDENPTDGFDGGAPQAAADVTDAGREAERRTLDDETDRPDF